MHMRWCISWAMTTSVACLGFVCVVNASSVYAQSRIVYPADTPYVNRTKEWAHDYCNSVARDSADRLAPGRPLRNSRGSSGGAFHGVGGSSNQGSALRGLGRPSLSGASWNELYRRKYEECIRRNQLNDGPQY